MAGLPPVKTGPPPQLPPGKWSLLSDSYQQLSITNTIWPQQPETSTEDPPETHRFRKESKRLSPCFRDLTCWISYHIICLYIYICVYYIDKYIMLCILLQSFKYFLQPILGETANIYLKKTISWDIPDDMLDDLLPRCSFSSDWWLSRPEKPKPTEVVAQDHISMNGVQLQGKRFPWAITRLTGVQHVLTGLLYLEPLKFEACWNNKHIPTQLRSMEPTHQWAPHITKKTSGY